MKKIIITCSIVFSGFCLAQESSDNPFVYDNPTTLADEDVFPSNPGDPNPAPIDDYIPALLLVAVGMIVLYKKKTSITE